MASPQEQQEVWKFQLDPAREQVLADRLIEKGESVEKDCHDHHIWSRTSGGQSIMLDSVIQDLALELWPYKGQEGAS